MFRSQNVFVMGEVRTPGRYTLTGSVTLVEALAQAGSTAPTAGSEVLILRPRKPTAARRRFPRSDDAEVQRINLRDIQAGKLSANVTVRDGDTIFVPKAQRFFVTGHVRNPGAYVLEPNLTVLQAISMAGGLTDRGSNKRVRIVRNKKEVRRQADRHRSGRRHHRRAAAVAVRVLFLNPTGRMGGAETALLEVMAGLIESRSGVAPRVDRGVRWPARRARAGARRRCARAAVPAALARFGEWSDRARRWSPLRLALRCARAAWPAWRYRARLRRVIRELAPDIVHSNGLKMHLLGAWARPAGRRSSGTFTITSPAGLSARGAEAVRAPRARRSSLRRGAWPKTSRAGRGAAADPRDLERRRPRALLAGWRHARSRRASGLPAPGDGCRARRPRRDVRAVEGTPPLSRGHRAAAAVAERARLCDRRRRLRDRGSQVSIEELREASTRLGLTGRVGFTGFIDDPAPAIRALDVLVHASTEPEPFGLAIAEGMACGRRWS